MKRFTKSLCGVCLAIPCLAGLTACGNDKPKQYNVTFDETFVDGEGYSLSTNLNPNEKGEYVFNSSWSEEARTVIVTVNIDRGYIVNDSFAVCLNSAPMTLTSVTSFAGEELTNEEKLALWTGERTVTYSGVVSSDAKLSIAGGVELANVEVGIDFRYENEPDSYNYDIFKVDREGNAERLVKDSNGKAKVNTTFGKELYLDYHADKKLDFNSYVYFNHSITYESSFDVVRNTDGSIFTTVHDGEEYFRVRVVAKDNIEDLVPYFSETKNFTMIQNGKNDLYTIALYDATGVYVTDSYKEGQTASIRVWLKDKSAFNMKNLAIRVKQNSSSMVITEKNANFDEISENNFDMSYFYATFRFDVEDNFEIEVGTYENGEFVKLKDEGEKKLVLNDDSFNFEEIFVSTTVTPINEKESVSGEGETINYTYNYSSFSDLVLRNENKIILKNGYGYSINISYTNNEYNVDKDNLKINLFGTDKNGSALNEEVSITKVESDIAPSYSFKLSKELLDKFAGDISVKIISGVTAKNYDSSAKIMSDGLENFKVYLQNADGTYSTDALVVTQDDSGNYIEVVADSRKMVKAKVVPNDGFCFGQNASSFAVKDDETGRLEMGENGEIYLSFSTNSSEIYVNAKSKENLKITFTAPCDENYNSYTFGTQDVDSGETTMELNALENQYTFYLYFNGTKVLNHVIYWNDGGINKQLTPDANGMYTISEKLAGDVSLKEQSSQTKNIAFDFSNLSGVDIYYRVLSGNRQWTKLENGGQIYGLGDYDDVQIKFVSQNGYNIISDSKIYVNYDESLGSGTIDFTISENDSIIEINNLSSYYTTMLTLSAENNIATTEKVWNLLIASDKLNTFVSSCDDAGEFSEESCTTYNNTHNKYEIASGNTIRIYLVSSNNFGEYDINSTKFILTSNGQRKEYSENLQRDEKGIYVELTLTRDFFTGNDDIYCSIETEFANGVNIDISALSAYFKEINVYKNATEFTSFDNNYIYSYDGTTITICVKMKDSYVDKATLKICLENDAKYLPFTFADGEGKVSFAVEEGMTGLDIVSVNTKSLTVRIDESIEVQVWNGSEYETITGEFNVEYGGYVRFRIVGNTSYTCVDADGIYSYPTYLFGDNGFIEGNDEYMLANITCNMVIKAG